MNWFWWGVAAAAFAAAGYGIGWRSARGQHAAEAAAAESSRRASEAVERMKQGTEAILRTQTTILKDRVAELEGAAMGAESNAEPAAEPEGTFVLPPRPNACQADIEGYLSRGEPVDVYGLAAFYDASPEWVGSQLAEVRVRHAYELIQRGQALDENARTGAAADGPGPVTDQDAPEGPAQHFGRLLRAELGLPLTEKMIGRPSRTDDVNPHGTPGHSGACGQCDD